MLTFETKIWEKDWRFILQGHYLQTEIERCATNFEDKMLMINNVNDITAVKKRADVLVAKGVIDRYIYVADFAQEVMGFFGITKEDFKGGYYYSIAELTSLYLCNTEFLLHFSGDALMRKDSSNWVNAGMEILRTQPNVTSVNACGNNDFEGAKTEASYEKEGFLYGKGFSDQNYLVHVPTFKQIDFCTQHPDSDLRYPKYGGELFEKRVDAYMQNNGKVRATSLSESYIHGNFPEGDVWWRRIAPYFAYVNARRLAWKYEKLI